MNILLKCVNMEIKVLSLQGSDLNSDLKDTEIAPNLNGVLIIKKDYGTEAGSDLEESSIHGVVQYEIRTTRIYDLSDKGVASLESGSVNDGVVLRKVFHTCLFIMNALTHL